MQLAMTSTNRFRRLAVSACCCAALAACGSTSDDTTVLVLAAASLTNVFGEFEAAFEEQHPDIDVVVSFAASSAILVQVEQGAPADVVALADVALIDKLTAGNLVEPGEVFATNRLAIAAPAGNPAGITSIDDFARGELTLGLCASQVPCGGYADELFATVGVSPDVDTRESNVASLSSKVVTGELDGAVMYITDVLAADGELVEVRLPDGVEVAARYPIAAVVGSDNADEGRTFIEFVRSDEGLNILTSAGFGAP